MELHSYSSLCLLEAEPTWYLTLSHASLPAPHCTSAAHFFFLSLNHAKPLKLCSCCSLNLQFSFPLRGLAFLPLGFCSNVTSSKKPSLTTLSKLVPHCPPSHNSYRAVLGSFSSLYLQLSSYAHHQLDFYGQGLCHSCLLLKP